MIQSFMHKVSTIFLPLLFVFTSLHAKEPTLAQLQSIQSNGIQIFSIGQYNFQCKPYGVVTIEKLFENAALDSICKKSIQKFYIKYPLLKEYSRYTLKPKQLYHVEFKERDCLVYVHSEMSLSEVLLREGLAVIHPTLIDEEFMPDLTKSERIAKANKKGLWKEEIIRNCLIELYK